MESKFCKYCGADPNVCVCYSSKVDNLERSKTWWKAVKEKGPPRRNDMSTKYPLAGPLNWTPEEPKETGLYLVCDPHKATLIGVVRVVFGPRGGLRPWRWLEPVRRHFSSEKDYHYARLTGPEWGNILPSLNLKDSTRGGE